jgi:hypothetical protein
VAFASNLGRQCLSGFNDSAGVCDTFTGDRDNHRLEEFESMNRRADVSGEALPSMSAGS